MQNPAPHVPAFALLAVASTLSYATFHAAIPLLPLLLPFPSTSFPAALALAAFLLPSLLLHPLISTPRLTPSLSLVLTAGALLQAIGSLLLSATRLVSVISPADATSLSRRLNLIELPATECILVTVALFVAGFGAAMSQFGLIRLVGEKMSALPTPHRRQLVGVHLAALEVCIAIGTVVAPLVFAIFASTRRNAFLPFLIVGVVQLVLALYLTFGSAICHSIESSIQNHTHDVLRSYSVSSRTYGSFPDSLQSATRASDIHDKIPVAFDDEMENDPGVLHALRHPWVWVVLFAMMVSAASSSFLRPVLTLHITEDLGAPRFLAASLFSLSALVGILSASLATAVVSMRLGVRNTVVLGMVFCLIGFRLLARRSWIIVAVMLLVAGSSSSLVMTLTDLSQTTQMNVLVISNSLNLLAAFTFSVGEITGTLLSGLLYDIYGSFEAAVSMWSQFLFIACVFVITSYLVGILIQCLDPWMYVAPCSRRRGTTEIPPLRQLLNDEDVSQ